MKRQLFATMLLVCTMTVQAQVKFGTKVGLNLTSFWGDNKVAGGIKPGFQAGLMMEWKFNNHWGVSPEVVYSMQSAKNSERTYNLDYINIPVMLKYYTSPHFSIDLGPQIGFNVRSKVKYAGSEHSRKAVAGDVAIGLGGTYLITDDLFAQARFTLGMSDCYHGDHNNSKNYSLQLSVGYAF